MSDYNSIILSGGTVLTMSHKFGIIEDGYVICKGDKISEIGQCPLPGGTTAFPDTQVIQAKGLLIMPGLINTHTHSPMSLLAGIADDLPLMEWLNKYIFPLENRLISPDFVYTGAMLSGLAMIRYGTTTVVDGYFFEHDAAIAIQELGMRGVMAQGILDFPNPQYKNPDEGFEIIKDFIGEWKESELIRPAIFCHSPYTCSNETLTNAKRLSLDTKAPYMIHLAETKDEVEKIRQLHGTTPAGYLERLGVLDHHTLAVHCTWLDGEDIRILAKGRVKVSHCPESNMKLAAGISPVPKLLDAGVCIGLGTDGCASNNNLDLFKEMDAAAKIHKVSTGDPTVMDAMTVLKMTNTMAARAIGMEKEIGSLEPGKKADLICLDLNQPHLTPLYNIPSQIVYSASGMDVNTVIINGKILLHDKEFKRSNPREILKRANRWAEKIAGLKQQL